jgi:hypothetical protein
MLFNVDFLKKYLSYLVIAALIVMIILMQQCRRTPEPEVITTVIHDTIPGDSISYEVLLPKPFPVYKDTGSTKWKYKDVDTCAILKDYFAEYYYQDTLKDDTSALVIVNDMVTENRLQNRKLIFQNRRSTVINTTINNYGEMPAHKIYFGAGLNNSVVNFDENTLGLTANVLWVTKNRWAYEASYDIFHNNIELTVFYKLSFKKKK